jgi:hypothetical protein
MIKFSVQWVILLLIGFGLSAGAQEIQIKSYVNKNQVALDEQFEYTIEVSGRSTSLPKPVFPDLNAFRVLSGPNTSTSIQFVNGAMSSSVTYNFYLSPKNEGNFIIPKAALSYRGTEYAGNDVPVSVTKASASQQQRQGNARQRTATDPEIAGENLFLKTEISRRAPYIGEQVIIEYRIYFRINIRGYNIDKLPANQGFWSEDFKLPAQPAIESEVVNGVNYSVATIRKTALFPTQSGELTIDPMQVTLEAVVKDNRRRDIFDSFFDDPFGRTVQKTISSKPVKLNVRSFPEAGRPAGFKGNVGNFKFDVSIDKTEARANEALALKLKVSGTGNIKLAELPVVQLPPDIEQYQPKINTQIENSGNNISGAKTAEYIIIPRHEGQYQVKPLTFAYFDPAAGAFRSITSPAINLNILKGDGSALSAGQAGMGLNRQEVALLGQDIRFIREDTRFTKISYKPYLSFTFWAGISGALLLFIGFFFYNEHQARLSGNERLARSLKAGKIAARQLAEARAQLNAAGHQVFYKAVSQALQGFVQHKLNIELTEFGSANVRDVLKRRGIDAQDIDEYLAVLQESDFKQYAGTSSAGEERRQLYDRAAAALTKLEKWI